MYVEVLAVASYSIMEKTFDEDPDLSNAIWESAQTEVVKQITLAKRFQCIEDFCAEKKCTTSSVLEQGDCALIATFLQLKRPYTPSIINMYRQQLSTLQRLNPSHYFHLSSLGGTHIKHANKKKMLIQHARLVVIPGTMIEQIDYQAISDLECAAIRLYCIIVETNQELSLQVFLPTSGVPSRCLNYLLLLTEHPVGSHVQPIHFCCAPPRYIIEDSLADTFKEDSIKLVQPFERPVQPITVFNPILQGKLSKEFRNEMVSQGSFSNRRLLTLPSIVALMLPLLLFFANLITTLLYLNITPAFTAASRSTTGYNRLSPQTSRVNHFSSPNLTALAVSALIGVTDDNVSSATVHYIGDVCDQFTSAYSFSYLTGCRVGDAKNPGPRRARSISAMTKSLTRSDAQRIATDAKQADFAKAHNEHIDAKRASIDATHAHLTKAQIEQIDAKRTSIDATHAHLTKAQIQQIDAKRASIEATQADLVKAHNEQPTAELRFSNARHESSTITAAISLQDSLPVPLVNPVIAVENPFHVSSEEATTAGLQAASDYFDISNITRQTCACCNERCKSKVIKTVKAEGHWLDRLMNRLNWDHTKYKVNDATKANYSAPSTALHLKGLPLAPSGVIVEMDGSAAVICSAFDLCA